MIEPVSAFKDNYFWWIQRGQGTGAVAAVVDPGASAPVLDQLAASRATLRAIVLTHHHADHIGGVEELARRTGALVYGPESAQIPSVDRRLHEGDRLDLPELDLALEVLAVPGHTLDHIAYVGRAAGVTPALFCGDTLFASGCGRLFEGTPAQMLASLDKLAALPEATRVYCAHEYTLANIAFARAVEPENHAIREWETQATRLRAQGTPTLPTTIGHEKLTNPFLRCEVREVRAAAAAQARCGIDEMDRVRTFATLRAWKNVFPNSL